MRKSFEFLLFGCLFIFSTFGGQLAFAQEEKLVFEEDQDRFNFAQMHLGYEYGLFDLTIPTLKGEIEQQAEIHSIIFGGWHFWGMADFYVAFPWKKYEDKGRNFSPGVETAFRWYPSPITNNKFRPFLGIGFAFTNYQQANNAPAKTVISYPINAGLSIANRSFQLEFGVRYQQNSEFDYHISSSQTGSFSIKNPSVFIALKRVVDTTLPSKRFGQVNQKSGTYPFFGIGPSSAWITDGKNSYFDANAAWIDNDVAVNVFPEFSLGVHWKNSESLSQRVILGVAFRQFDYTLRGFGSHYKLSYNSYAVEIAQTLFDYHGFVPFVGLSYNSFNVAVSGDLEAKQSDTVVGALFGWDILPVGSRAPWTLRTNLRWYPQIELVTDDKKTIAFPNFEFNFIQWVYQF